jgi:SAM-dependent methyltransferase
MPTPLERVRELNYDHHRRMAELYAGGQRSEAVDEQSYRALLAHVPVGQARLLELGSASGGQWDLLKEWSNDLHGIDLYLPLVKDAQKRGLNIEFGYVENMRMFPNDTFDLVCSRHVMEHLGDLDQGIREILRVAKPGAYIAHVTPNMEHDNEPAHLNHLDETQWTTLWLLHGLRVLHHERHPFHGGEVHIVGRKP